MEKALLLVDIQNDYFPGGASELTGSVEAGAKAARLLDSCRRNGIPVIHMRHVSTRAGATFFLPGTDGANINSCVSPAAGEPVFEKHYANSLRETPLLEYLRTNGIKTLIIAGMMSHMCIESTTRAADSIGFKCIVAHDACATKDLAFNGVTVPASHVHNAFMAGLDGVFARVLPVDEIIGLL
jgi:nicotinamidase-related amidase